MTSKFGLENLNTGRVVIMAEYPVEKTTDVPEHAFLAVR